MSKADDRSRRVDHTAIEVREMNRGDFSPYCRLFASVFAQAPWHERWDAADVNRSLERSFRRRGFLGLVAGLKSGETGIASGGGYLTGFAVGIPGLVSPSFFYIDQLFVSPELQGRRIGVGLLNEAERLLSGRALSGIVLLTKPDSVAEKFYLRNGYGKLPVLRLRRKSLLWKSRRRLTTRDARPSTGSG